jgi:hypothetical protein
MIVLVCLNIAIALIIAPVLTSMYMRMVKLERKIENERTVKRPANSVDQSSQEDK